MSGLTQADLEAVARALIEASRRVSGEGTPVRYLRSSYVAAEHRWLGLFVGSSSEAVNRVFGIAQVPDGSVIEVADDLTDGVTMYGFPYHGTTDGNVADNGGTHPRTADGSDQDSPRLLWSGGD